MKDPYGFDIDKVHIYLQFLNVKSGSFMDMEKSCLVLRDDTQYVSSHPLEVSPNEKMPSFLFLKIALTKKMASIA